MLFIEYPKCSTCKKAKKYLEEHGIEFEDRHIVEENRQRRSWRSGSASAASQSKSFLTPAG